MICGWPKASYPTSEADESRVLESVRSTVKSAATPVSAIVVEPTQQSSGYSVSDKFIQELYSIARENDAALVVDETSSSCHATGNFWQYKGPADFVTFGRRAQATGYFSKSEGLTALGGSENDVKLLKLILDGVQKDGLDAKVKDVAAHLDSKASDLSVGGVTGARSSGNCLWVDTDNVTTATNLVSHLRSHGILVKQNGQRGIVAKPALIFGKSQCDELFTALHSFK